MNKELIDFIEICLQDNLISEKERKVIFKKADELKEANELKKGVKSS